MSESRTDISELGEFGIIDQLTKGLELKNASSILGEQTSLGAANPHRVAARGERGDKHQRTQQQQ